MNYVIVIDDPAGLEDFMFWSDELGPVETINEATRYTEADLRAEYHVVKGGPLGDQRMTVIPYLESVGYENIRTTKVSSRESRG